MTREEQIREEEVLYKLSHNFDCNHAFEAGAKWADTHHDYNYAAIDSKMSEIEHLFLTKWIKGHNYMPTYSDALEWEKNRMIDKACEWLENTFIEICDLSKMTDNISIISKYKRKSELINDFKRAMEE